MKTDTNNKLESFFSKFKKIIFKKGDIIIRGDDEPSSVYYIAYGHVKMSSMYEDGDEISVNILKPKSFFPMISVFGNIENSYFFKAINTVETYKAPKVDIVLFLKENPEVIIDLTTRLIIGFESMLKLDKKLMKANSPQKVSLIIEMLTKRFGTISNNSQIELDIPVTHQDIASFAGLSRETTSLAIGSLRKKNIISTSGNRITILDINKLKLHTTSK